MAKAGGGNRAGSRWGLVWFVLALGLASVACLAGRAAPASAICQDPPCIEEPPPPPPTLFDLGVTLQGRGVVTDATNGVNCSHATGTNADSSAVCTTSIEQASPVTLVASGNGDYDFDHWSGGPCSGSATATCAFSMDAPATMTAVFVDDTPPGNPVIGAQGEGDLVRSDLGEVLGFTAGSGAVSHTCRVLSGATVLVQHACAASGWNPGSLPTSSALTFSVVATDENGNSATSDPRTFKYVNVADTALTGGPGEHSSTRSAHTTFVYTSTIAGASFRCRLSRDGAALSNTGCVPDLGGTAGLPDGAYTLSAFAGVQIPGDGGTTYEDRTPVTRSWRVDTAPPQTAISSGPSDGLTTNDTSATFAFAGADVTPAGYVANLTYECKLDGGAFQPCAGALALSGLGFASHTFEVRAVDQAGNADPTPATRSWKVISDLDGDGVQLPADCNDTDPAIHPGAYDRPGDAINQDCSADGAADYQRPGTSLSASWAVVRGRTAFPVFKVSGVPKGAKVTLSCKGKGCTFKSKKLRLRHGKADLRKLMKKVKLGKGAVLDLRTVAPDMLVSLIRVKVVKGGAAKTTKLCIRPGQTKTFACG